MWNIHICICFWRVALQIDDRLTITTSIPVYCPTSAAYWSKCRRWRARAREKEREIRLIEEEHTCETIWFQMSIWRFVPRTAECAHQTLAHIWCAEIPEIKYAFGIRLSSKWKSACVQFVCAVQNNLLAIPYSHIRTGTGRDRTHLPGSLNRTIYSVLPQNWLDRCHINTDNLIVQRGSVVENGFNLRSENVNAMTCVKYTSKTRI